jgi:hypothetical protein
MCGYVNYSLIYEHYIIVILVRNYRLAKYVVRIRFNNNNTNTVQHQSAMIDRLLCASALWEI